MTDLTSQQPTKKGWPAVVNPQKEVTSCQEKEDRISNIRPGECACVSLAVEIASPPSGTQDLGDGATRAVRWVSPKVDRRIQSCSLDFQPEVAICWALLEVRKREMVQYLLRATPDSSLKLN